jgi:uncharacterized protein (TIGR03435 family)
MRIFKAIAAGFILPAFLAGNSFAVADKDGPKIGDVPPPLTLTKTIQGLPAGEINWDKLKGKVVVLEFWATWCGPCVKAIPHLNELVEQFKDKPVVFISVTSENEDVVRVFLKNHPLKASILLDDFETLNKAFHVAGIPHTVIVDASGHIAAITHPDNLKAENLDEIIAGKKSSLPEPEVYTVGKSTEETVKNEVPALYEIAIRDHKMPPNIQGPICMWTRGTNGCEFEGKIATVESALKAVFDAPPTRTIVKCKLPDDFYDFQLRAPAGHAADLQNQFIAALRATFGIDVKPTTEEMDVYVMTQINTNAPGLHSADKPSGGGQMAGGFRLRGSPMKGVAEYLEGALNVPVFDETGQAGFFDVDMKWKLSEAEKQHEFKPDAGAVVAAARERLGLDLKLVRRPVKILEVRPISH